MVIITLSHQKGGVGKTSLSLSLYSYLEKEGVDVAIYDFDPQGSIRQSKSEFEEEGNRWSQIQLIDEIDGDIKQLEQLDHEVLIIDTPPYLSSELPDIFKISDFVIFPCKPASFDLLAIRSSIELLEETGTKGGIILNMVKGTSNFQGFIKESLDDFDMYIFETEIKDRVIYSKGFLFTYSILESEDEKAKAEITKWGNEVLEVLEKLNS